MKYISISKNETLVSLTNKVGINSVDQLIADNGLQRRPDIGKQWKTKCDDAKKTSKNVEPTQKVSILNQFIQNSDIYEKAALASENEWKVLAATNSFSDCLYVSDQLQDSIVDSYNVLGNKESVPSSIYQSINQSILNRESIDASLFSTYSTIQNVGLIGGNTVSVESSNPLGWFKIPQSEVLLYSSLSDSVIAIPAYPEKMSDRRTANYTTMPNLIYQYEPWQLYESSGPRSNTYEFHLHRDMWTGNHLDGKANELIRFCEAQCYPKYDGSAVNTSTVSLYVSGSNLITGVMTEVSVDWSGPLGLDGFYLEFTLSLNITEVSKMALNYESVMNKPLIG